jgi:hypothetical protein
MSLRTLMLARTASVSLYSSLVIATAACESGSPVADREPIGDVFGLTNTALAGNAQELGSGQIVSGVAGSKGQWRLFHLAVPADANRLSVRSWGGSGDADLYLRKDQPPEDGKFDFSSARPGNWEEIELAVTGGAGWYIGVRAFEDYDGLELKAEYDLDAPTETIFSGQTVYNLAGERDSWRFYRIFVGSGGGPLQVDCTSGLGDVNVYIKQGIEPTAFFYDAHTFGGGTFKTARIANASPGFYYVGLLGGWSGYEAVWLRAAAR